MLAPSFGNPLDCTAHASKFLPLDRLLAAAVRLGRHAVNSIPCCPFIAHYEQGLARLLLRAFARRWLARERTAGALLQKRILVAKAAMMPDSMACISSSLSSS